MDERLLVICLSRAEAETVAVRYARYLRRSLSQDAAEIEVATIDEGQTWGDYRRVEGESPAELEVDS